MNIYNLLHIKHISNFNLPDAGTIERILNEIITPEFEKLGLSNDSYKYLWCNDYNDSQVKTIIRFTYRGPTGGLLFGSNFKFIPVINAAGKVRRSPDKLHLFEGIGFFNADNEISLWNERFFAASLRKFIKNNSAQIRRYISYSSSLQNNIETALRQIKGEEYTTRHPAPEYVLAFLYAKTGEAGKAQEVMKHYLMQNNLDNSFLKLLEKI